ncbi:MAG: hypothetical protein ABF809_11095 [Gluconobacter potus]|nr:MULTISPECIES: hypothetical protein [unclassified Gluconobacter]
MINDKRRWPWIREPGCKLVLDWEQDRSMHQQRGFDGQALD